MEKVFLNSIPKAGTNLLAKALDIFGFEQKGHIDGGRFLLSGITRIPSSIRRMTAWTLGQGYIVGIDIPIEVNRRVVDNLLHNLKPGQYITAHAGYTSDILNAVNLLKVKSVLMLRDPRAIIASQVPYILRNNWHPVHNALKKMKSESRYQAILEGFSEGRVGIQSMYTCCWSVEEWIRSENILKIRFENLVGPQGGGTTENQRRALEQICTFIGAPFDKIDNVVSNLFGPGRKTFRKGRIDSWRDEIPPKVQKQMSEILEPYLQQWGYI